MEKFPGEYLNTKLEPKVGVRLEDKYIDKDALLQYKYVKEDTVEFVKGESKTTLKYSTPSLKKFWELAKPAFNNEEHNSPTNKFFSLFNLFFNRIKQIDEFKIENSKKAINVHSIVGEDYNILFNPSSSSPSGSLIDMRQKIILLKGTPLNKKGLLALFHEIGHKEWSTNKINSSKSQEFILDMYLAQGNRESNGEFKLKEERGAWAHALNNLKNFIKDFDLTNREINEVIHMSCLKSYSDFIRKELEKPPIVPLPS